MLIGKKYCKLADRGKGGEKGSRCCWVFVLLFAAIFGGRNWISDSGHQQVVDRLDRIIELQLMERDGTHRHLETEHALRHLEDAIERLAETQTKDQERQNNQLPDYLVESSGQEKIVRIPQYD